MQLFLSASDSRSFVAVSKNEKYANSTQIQLNIIGQ